MGYERKNKKDSARVSGCVQNVSSRIALLSHPASPGGPPSTVGRRLPPLPIFVKRMFGYLFFRLTRRRPDGRHGDVAPASRLPEWPTRIAAAHLSMNRNGGWRIVHVGRRAPGFAQAALGDESPLRRVERGGPPSPLGGSYRARAPPSSVTPSPGRAIEMSPCEGEIDQGHVSRFEPAGLGRIDRSSTAIDEMKFRRGFLPRRRQFENSGDASSRLRQ